MALGEFELIGRFFDRGPAREALLGVGDDCALIAGPEGRALAVAVDTMVAGRHFRHDASPESVGHKALAVNLSDLAAMGARPQSFLLALALPEADERWLEGFSKGMFALADRFGCELIGGDTTRGPLNVSVTVIGEVPPEAALRRDAAQPGDDLWVSGELGAAAFAVREAAAGRELPPGDAARIRLDWPEPRVALGLALRHLARAAIDVSDGLLADLGHVADRSRVGAEVRWESVPVAAALASLPSRDRASLALAGGDDYELLFTAAPENRVAIEALSARLELPLTRIGTIDAGQGVRVVDGRGHAVATDGTGFDHFA